MTEEGYAASPIASHFRSVSLTLVPFLSMHHHIHMLDFLLVLFTSSYHLYTTKFMNDRGKSCREAVRPLPFLSLSPLPFHHHVDMLLCSFPFFTPLV